MARFSVELRPVRKRERQLPVDRPVGGTLRARGGQPQRPVGVTTITGRPAVDRGVADAARPCPRDVLEHGPVFVAAFFNRRQRETGLEGIGTTAVRAHSIVRDARGFAIEQQPEGRQEAVAATGAQPAEITDAAVVFVVVEGDRRRTKELHRNRTGPGRAPVRPGVGLARDPARQRMQARCEECLFIIFRTPARQSARRSPPWSGLDRGAGLCVEHALIDIHIAIVRDESALIPADLPTPQHRSVICVHRREHAAIGAVHKEPAVGSRRGRLLYRVRRSGLTKPQQFQRPADAMVAGDRRVPVERAGQLAPHTDLAPLNENTPARALHASEFRIAQGGGPLRDDDQVREHLRIPKRCDVGPVVNGNTRAVVGGRLAQAFAFGVHLGFVRQGADDLEFGLRSQGFGQRGVLLAQDQREAAAQSSLGQFRQHVRRGGMCSRLGM